MIATPAARRTVLPRMARLAGATVAAFLITFAVLVLGTAYKEAANWTHPLRVVPDTTPSAYGMPYEEVRLSTEDGVHLAAWYVPSPSGPTVVLLHGLHGNRAGDLPLAANLYDRGYGFIIPDLRAHGESDGTVTTLGVKETRDVRAAVDYLKAREDVDRERIGILGTSLGAAVTIMSASEIPELRAAVATSGFASIEWVVQHQFEMLESVPQWLAPVVVAMGSLQTGVNVREMAPVQRIGAISPRPVLIIHGELDDTFAVDNALLLNEAAGEPKELWLIPGARHSSPGAYAINPEAYVDRVAEFFDQYLS